MDVSEYLRVSLAVAPGHVLDKRRRRLVRRGAHPVAAVPRQHVAGCNGLLGQPWPPARSPCRSIVFLMKFQA